MQDHYLSQFLWKNNWSGFQVTPIKILLCLTVFQHPSVSGRKHDEVNAMALEMECNPIVFQKTEITNGRHSMPVLVDMLKILENYCFTVFFVSQRKYRKNKILGFT